MESARWRRSTAVGGVSQEVEQLLWYAGGLVVGFFVPFIFSSVLDWQHDLYYATYFSLVALFLAAYVLETRLDVRELFRRGWKLSLVLGVIASAFVVWNVLAREDSTPRPDGAYFVFTIFWRGALYGVIDALLLSAFPVAVAYSLFHGRLETAGRRVAFSALALVLVVVITAVYHLGYEQYRDDGVGQPETGNTVISLPAIISVSPVGSILAHASMHIAADTHAYETDIFLPPQTNAD